MHPTAILPTEIWTIVAQYCPKSILSVHPYFRALILDPLSPCKLFATDANLRVSRRKTRRAYMMPPNRKTPKCLNTNSKEYKERVRLLGNIAHKVVSFTVEAPATLVAILKESHRYHRLECLINRTKRRLGVTAAIFPRKVEICNQLSGTWQESAEEGWREYFELSVQ